MLYSTYQGFKIRTYDKLVSDIELEYNLSDLITHDNIDLAKFDSPYCEIYITRKGLKESIDVHFSFDKSNIFINARTINQGPPHINDSRSMEEWIVSKLNNVS